MENIIITNENLTAEIQSTGAEIISLKYKDMQIGTKGGIKGRCANRIKAARFTLNGTLYKLPANVAPNHLHGGPMGFSKLPWECVEKTESTAKMKLISPDGDMGYPGRMIMNVKYSLLPDGILIEIFASTDKDTILNPLNHLYFNLNGTQSSEDHQLWIDSDEIIQTDEEYIPSGRMIDVTGTRYDFRKPRLVKGHYDNSYALDLDPEKTGFRKAAVLTGLKSGLRLEMLTDRPCMQLYNTEEEICLEAQAYPDAINHPEFPSNILRAGEPFYTRTMYKIG